MIGSDVRDSKGRHRKCCRVLSDSLFIAPVLNSYQVRRYHFIVAILRGFHVLQAEPFAYEFKQAHRFP